MHLHVFQACCMHFTLFHGIFDVPYVSHMCLHPWAVGGARAAGGVLADGGPCLLGPPKIVFVQQLKVSGQELQFYDLWVQNIMSSYELILN